MGGLFQNARPVGFFPYSVIWTGNAGKMQENAGQEVADLGREDKQELQR